MYTGNGVTRKFPLPIGYDGEVVYLIFPTGKSIKMVKDEGYTVSEGAVYFSAAIPAGVVVSFEEPEDAGDTDGVLKYVVIYKDGRIVEVSEDPAEYLAQTQQVLAEAKKHYEEVKEYASQAVKDMMTLKSTLADNFEGLLYDYTTRGKEVITENANLLKSEIRTELEGALLRIQTEAQTVESGLQIMELLKKEAQQVSGTTAEATKQEILSKCYEAIEACEETAKIKADCEYCAEEAKSAAQKAYYEAQAALNRKIDEELEMLRSLRLRLESDSEAMNTRFNSVWEILRGEINGR